MNTCKGPSTCKGLSTCKGQCNSMVEQLPSIQKAPGLILGKIKTVL